MSALPAFGLVASLPMRPAGDSRRGARSLLSAERTLPSFAGGVFAAMDRERALTGVTIQALCAAADTSLRAYHYYRAGVMRPGRPALQALQSALDRLARRPEGDTGERLARAALGGFLAQAAGLHGIDVAVVRALGRHNKGMAEDQFRAASAARQLAIYLVNQEVGLRQAVLARLVGQSRAAVCLAIRAIEDRRGSDRAFDRAVKRIISTVTGGE